MALCGRAVSTALLIFCFMQTVFFGCMGVFAVSTAFTLPDQQVWGEVSEIWEYPALFLDYRDVKWNERSVLGNY